MSGNQFECPRDVEANSCRGCDDVAKDEAMRVAEDLGYASMNTLVAEQVLQYVTTVQNLEQPLKYVDKIVDCGQRREKCKELAVELTNMHFGEEKRS